MFDKIQINPEDENEHFKQPHIAIEKLTELLSMTSISNAKYFG